jgi:chromate transporter
MNLAVLYLLFLKATLTSFSGLTSLPIVHQELVVNHRAISERELNTAVAVARMGPGPNGLYLAGAGYYTAGPAGAAAGYFALITPAFAAVLLLRWFGARAARPRWRGAIAGLTAAAAGLMLHASIPLARDALTSWSAAVLAAVSFWLLSFRHAGTLPVFAAAAAASILFFVFGIR